MRRFLAIVAVLTLLTGGLLWTVRTAPGATPPAPVVAPPGNIDAYVAAMDEAHRDGLRVWIEADLVKRWVALGFHISFAGTVVDEKARRIRAAASATPLDRLLVETDAPDQTPIGRRPAACPPRQPSRPSRSPSGWRSPRPRRP